MQLTGAALGAAAGALLLAFVGLGIQTARVGAAHEKAEALAAELRAARGDLLACGARVANLIEDMESDNAIDALPSDALTVVPAHWLRAPGTDADAAD